MKAKKYSIVICSVVCSCAIGSAARPQPPTTENLQLQLFGGSTLRGALPVYLQVMMTLTVDDANETRSASRIGPLSRNDLQSLVQQRLRDSAIRTVDSYGEPTSAAPLSLGITVTIAPVAQDAGPNRLYAALVCTEVHQPVVLLRDEKIRILNRTWPVVHKQGVTQRLFVLNSKNLEDTIKNEVDRQVGLFINDYVAANSDQTPQEEETAGISQIPADMTTWVKCRNPDCQASYEMNLRQFYTYLEEHGVPDSLLPPALVCRECNEKSVFEAFKCEKCDRVFEKGTVPRDFEDRCPVCRYSKIEELRRKAAGIGRPNQ